jgi:predicted nucleic acid-binding protein
VNIYVDTNVVVARTVKGHQHQANAIQLFREIAMRRWTPVISAHGLAEFFSVLTRTPFPRRVSSIEAWKVIEENILPLFEVEALTKTDYKALLQNCAANGLSGGLVYDAIHIFAARKAKCSRIYTLNVKHFRLIAPDLQDRILSP